MSLSDDRSSMHVNLITWCGTSDYFEKALLLWSRAFSCLTIEIL